MCTNAVPRKWTRYCVITGIISIVVGIFIVTFIPIYMKTMVHQNFQVDSPTAKGLASYLKMPKDQATLYQSFYIFNITNPHEVTNEGAGPIITEHGPYTYAMNKYKVEDSLAWRANDTLEYIQHCDFTFVPAMSTGSESDIFTTPNLGYIGALNKMRDQPSVLALIQAIIDSEKVPLFMVNALNVSQIIWGYNNTLLEQLHALVPSVSPVVQLQAKNDINDVILPAAVMAGGEPGEGYPSESYNDIKRMTMWNGMDQYLTYWNTSYANMINGTDGLSFHPYLEYGGRVPVFSDTLYRSAFMDFCGKDAVHGIKVYCLTITDDTFLSGEHNPDNKAFYITTSGVIPFPTAVGKPIHITLPRFYRANVSDPLLASVKYPEGTVVNAEECDTRLHVEPFTGQLLKAHKRIQINTLLEPGVTAPQNATHTYCPVAWVDQYPIIADAAITKIKVMVYLPYYGSLVVGPFLIAVGLALVIVATVRCTICKREDGEVYAGSSKYIPLSENHKDYRGSASVNK